jgi:hypothetical protein
MIAMTLTAPPLHSSKPFGGGKAYAACNHYHLPRIVHQRSLGRQEVVVGWNSLECGNFIISCFSSIFAPMSKLWRLKNKVNQTIY